MRVYACMQLSCQLNEWKTWADETAVLGPAIRNELTENEKKNDYALINSVHTNDYALVNSVHTNDYALVIYKWLCPYQFCTYNSFPHITQQHCAVNSSTIKLLTSSRTKKETQNSKWPLKEKTTHSYLLTSLWSKKETQERKNTKFKMVSEREDNSQLILDKLGHHFQSKRQDVGGPEAQCWTLGLQDLAKVGLDEGNGAEGSTDVIGETAVGKVVQGVGGHEQANTSLHGDLWGKTVHQLWKGKPPIWLKKNVGRWHI